MTLSRTLKRKQRHFRVRKKVIGTNARPRLNVFRSNNHIAVQIIDDVDGKTLVSLSSNAADHKDKYAGKRKLEVAREVGKDVAKMAIAAGIKRIVFDRGGFKYHGRVKALAEGAREGGLEF